MMNAAILNKKSLKTYARVTVLCSNNDVQEEFEDTKGVIRIRKSKKDRQHNDQKKNDKRKTIYKTWT